MTLRQFIKAVRWFAFGGLSRWGYLQYDDCRRAATGMHWSARLDRQGALACAQSVVIGCRTYLRIPSGAQLILKKGAWLGDDCEINPLTLIKIGLYSSIQNRSIILGDVTIGSGCACGANLYISSSKHHFEDPPEFPIRWQDAQALSLKECATESQPVIVGDDCWIGINVVITPGIKIGRGCVIGANSVVTKDLPPYSVAAGAPAKVLKQRLNFSPPNSLQANRIEHIPYFYSGFLQWREGVKNLHQAIQKEGWETEDEFSVMLAVKRGIHLRLTVKAEVEGEICHESQIIAVAPGMGSIDFLACPAIDGLLTFKWTPLRKHRNGSSTLVILAVDQK